MITKNSYFVKQIYSETQIHAKPAEEKYFPTAATMIRLSVSYYFTEPLGDYRGGENFNEVRHYIRHYAFKQNNA